MAFLVKNKKTGTAVWYIAFLPVMFISIRCIVNCLTISPKISYGEIIAIILIFFGLITPIIIAISRWRLLNYPFKMYFTNNALKEEPKKLQKKETTLSADGKFYLYLTTKREIKVEEIDLRFVEKKRKYFLKSYFVNVPKNIICIDKIDDPKTMSRVSLTGRNFKYSDDEKGGMYGYYKPIYHCPKGEIIFIEIHPVLPPNKPWTGHISLQVLLGDAKRTCTRRKITINP